MGKLPEDRPIPSNNRQLLTRSAYNTQMAELWARSGFTHEGMATACEHERTKDKEVAQVSDSTIHNWMNGKTTPNPQSEKAFRFVLGLLGADQQQQDLLLDSAREFRRRRRRPDTSGPYRGLNSYEISDAEDFFGRDALVNIVLAELDALHATGGGVGLVSGVSGAGKSSLLKAGVIPKLRSPRPDGAPGRQALYVKAGPDPLLSLARVVAECLGAEIGEITAALRAGPAGIAEVVRRLAVGRAPSAAEAPDPMAGVVLVVDQFEQTLNAEGNDIAVREFLAVLSALAEGPIPAAVLLGVRSDFLPAAMRAVRNLSTRQPVTVGPMQDGELLEVIERPADKYKIALGQGLSELLLSEISAWGGRRGHEAGILPWVSHALLMTYKASAGSRKEMTVTDYRKTGGLDGAINATADEVYGTLSPAQQEITRQLFLTLIDSNLSGADTRQKVRLDEIDQLVGGYSPAALTDILDRFVGSRLLTVDEDTVEITHDVVMVAWAELAGWLQEDRATRVAGRKLNTAAREWDSKDRRADLLYRGGSLDDASAWCDAHPDDVQPLAREFVDAGRRAATRTTRIWQSVGGALSLLLVVVIVLFVVTVVQNHTVQQQRDEAQSRTLASESVNLRGKDPTLARLLALAAYRISPTIQARSALIDATAMPSAVRMLSSADSIMNAVALHPRGSVAAMAAGTGLLLSDIRDRAHPHQLPPPPGTPHAQINALAYSPDGTLLAAACGDGSLHLWDTRNPLMPIPLPTLNGLGSTVYSLAYSADGTMLAAAIGEAAVTQTPTKSVHPGSVRLWRLDGTTPRPLGGAFRVDDTAPAKSVSFRRDGKTLAVGADDGAVQLWDITTPDHPGHPGHPVTATGTNKAIGQLAFSPDGNTLVAGGADFTVHVWSTRDPRNPAGAGDPIAGADSWVNAVAFSPDGTTLAIASSDQRNGLRLVDMASRRTIATLPHPSPVTSVRFSADGSTIITGANDGTARLWSTASPTVAGMNYPVSATRFSPDGTRLAIGSGDLRVLDVTQPSAPHPIGAPQTNRDDFSGVLVYSPDGRLLAEGQGVSGTVQLWNTASSGPLTPIGRPLGANAKEVDALAFSPDGTMLATGGRDGAVHLWDVRTAQAPVPLSTPGTGLHVVNDLAFSPDGRLLVAGGTDKTIRIWDVSTPRTPKPVGQPVIPGTHYVYATKFSPDGTMLAVGLADSTIRLYDVADPVHPRQLGQPLTGPGGYVYALSFNSDGKTLAAAATDSTAWLWDVHDHAAPIPQATLTISSGALYAIDFRHGSSVLAAGGSDMRAYVWTTDPDEAAALVCATTGDPITPAEWTKYMPDRQYISLCP
jgi:WD40 repeat protein